MQSDSKMLRKNRSLPIDVKKFHLADAKEVVILEKEKAAQLLAMYLKKEDIISVPEQNLSALQRSNVSKVKAF